LKSNDLIIIGVMNVDLCMKGRLNSQYH